MQVEDHVCLTGGEDGNIRLWDLRKVDEEEDDDWERGSELITLSEVAEEEDSVGGFSTPMSSLEPEVNGNGIRQAGSISGTTSETDGPCVRVLEGHSQAVSALYFEENCLVRSLETVSAVNSTDDPCFSRLRVHLIRRCVSGTWRLVSV